MKTKLQIFVTKIDMVQKVSIPMSETVNIERISIYPGDYTSEKRKKLLDFLADSGIRYSYEAY